MSRNAGSTACRAVGTLLVLLAAAWPGTASGPRAEVTAPVRVLFIGNSYTSVNDLPATLAEVARSAGERRPLEARTIARGGATLQAHWESGEAAGALRGARWDYVVLQEQSVLPAVDPERMSRYVRLFDAEIRRSGARTVLFLTWARAGNPEMQGALDRAYEASAAEVGALLAPVGPAWARALAAKPGIRLHQEDGSHPTRLGTELAASVFYAVLYGKPPPEARGGADARLARKVAWESVVALR